MLYTNEKTVRVLKILCLITGLACVLAMTLLIFLEAFMILAILTGVFLLGLILISVLNFQCIYIGIKADKLVIRYYSVFSVNRNYESIEIPIDSLRNIKVKKLFFGLKWDFRLTVKIRQGIADYPAVSLSAVPFKARRQLLTRLNLLIPVKL